MDSKKEDDVIKILNIFITQFKIQNGIIVDAQEWARAALPF